jgi:RNA polymerase sigma-70 factor (ECF subfamily)
MAVNETEPVVRQPVVADGRPGNLDAARWRDERFEAEALACLPDVVRFARSLTRDEASADDLVQETYLRAYRGYASFVADSDMRRWLFSICHHAWLRINQREQRMVLTTDGDEAELETLAAVMGHVAAQRTGLDRFVGTLDLGPAIARAVEALAPPFRSAVLLVDVEGMAYEEAAAVLEVPVGTVRSRLFRARRLLQEQLFEFARDAGFTGAAPSSPRPPRNAPV